MHYTKAEIAAFARRYENGGLTEFASHRIFRILKSAGHFGKPNESSGRSTQTQEDLANLAGADGYLGDGVHITDF